jgi:hypothetical protein
MIIGTPYILKLYTVLKFLCKFFFLNFLVDFNNQKIENNLRMFWSLIFSDESFIGIRTHDLTLTVQLATPMSYRTTHMKGCKFFFSYKSISTNNKIKKIQKDQMTYKCNSSRESNPQTFVKRNTCFRIVNLISRKFLWLRLLFTKRCQDQRWIHQCILINC